MVIDLFGVSYPGEDCWHYYGRSIELCADYWENWDSNGSDTGGCGDAGRPTSLVDGTCLFVPAICANEYWLNDPTVDDCVLHPECCDGSMPECQ